MKKPKDLVMLIAVLLIGVILGLQVKVVSAMTFQQAQRIYYQVGAKNFFTVPKLIYTPSKEANARWTGHFVVVYQGMLDSVRNQSEMAIVFGHELGHYQQAHWGRGKIDEYLADKLGFTFAVKSGFSGCKGMKWILRNGGQVGDHPSGRDRYNRLCGGR